MSDYELIRCKDCFWYRKIVGVGGCARMGYNPLNPYYIQFVDDDTFCAFGIKESEVTDDFIEAVRKCKDDFYKGTIANKDWKRKLDGR